MKYEVIGRFKNEERFSILPFVVEYSSNCQFIGASFYVDIISENQFKIARSLENGDWQTQDFDKPFSFHGCALKLTKTNNIFINETLKISLQSEEQILDYLEAKLEVAPENLNANTIKIAFTDYNPYKVEAIVRTISELYTRYSREQKNQANELKINFLNSQLRDVEEVINNYESYIEEFTLKNKTANPQQDLNFVINQINRIDSTITDLKLQQKRVDSFIANLDKDSTSVVNDLKIANYKGLSEILAEYNEVKNTLNDLKARYKQESQLLIKKKAELDFIKTRLKDYLIAYKDFLVESTTQAQANKMKLNALFNKLPAKSNELNQKMRFYSIYEDLYLSLMQRKTEFQIAKAGTVAEVVILTPANFPKFPIGPSNLILYASAILFGIMLSVFFILIRYFVYNEIISLAELEKLTSLPIVGKINRIRSSKAKKSGVMVFEQPRSQISESFRSLRAGLNFMGLKNDQQIIAVTSSISGEGKTFIAVNLAAVLSLSNKRTIILDLDMRKPRAQYAFNIQNNDTGVSAILSGNANWKDCIHTTQNDNLHLITSGILPPNPSELLEGVYFQKLLTELKSEYDIIILDTPPIGLVSDGIIALKKADQSLYIIRSDYSKRSFIQDLHRSVDLNGIENISLVFNAARSKQYSNGYYQDYYDNNLSKSAANLWGMLKKG